jgi:hypothetical protein
MLIIDCEGVMIKTTVYRLFHLSRCRLEFKIIMKCFFLLHSMRADVEETSSSNDQMHRINKTELFSN